MQTQKILIVDDNDENLFTLKQILKKLQVEVISAKNGNEALIAVLEHTFALAILDVQMPEMDGYELAQIIRDQDDTHYLPIIFLTAVFSDEIHVSKGYESGAVDFLTKPYNPDILIAKVQIFLELGQQKEHLEWQKQQLLKTNQFIRESKERVELVNKRMTASLEYAKLIQHSLLPNPNHFKSSFKEGFYILMSRDIVGGDFIFIEHIGQKIIIAVIDCTGHGVPGALMTIVATFGLRHIIIENGEHNPRMILSYLNEYIKTKLGQNNLESLSDDGLDAAIALIDKEAETLVYAGARLPLLYVKGDAVERIRGDNHSIGYKHSEDHFRYTNHTLDTTQASAFYMYTDGFIDQVDVQGLRRFGTKQLVSLLLDNLDKPFSTQREILIKAFNDHKGANLQQDDITLVGFKI